MLLLFDIDGTLVTGASRAHTACLVEALDEVHGVHAKRTALNVSAAGRTDGEIARLMLLGPGCRPSGSTSARCSSATRAAGATASWTTLSCHRAVVPGIPEVLTGCPGSTR